MAVERSAIRLLLERARRAGLVPGAVAAWGEGKSGDPQTVAHGAAAELPQPVPVTPQTIYDLASLTKPLCTTTLLLLAVREGRLALDTAVQELLPMARGKPVGELTIRHLATHTSGLPGWLPLYALAKGKRERALPVLVDTPLSARPGTRVTYSCPGFILLGLLLEVAFGQAIGECFRVRIALPLGLQAGFDFSPAGRHIAAGAQHPSAEEALLSQLGFAHDARWLPASHDGAPDDGNCRFLGGAAGNSGLIADATSNFTLAGQYLKGVSGLLDAEEIELATHNYTPGLEQARGLGWQLAASPGSSAGPALPPHAFGHNGFTGTSVWVDPEQGRVMLLLANRNHPSHRGVDLHPLRRRFHSLVCGLQKDARSAAL